MSHSVIRAYAAADRGAIERMAGEVVRAGTVFPFENTEDCLKYWFTPGGQVFVAQAEEILGSYVLKPNHPGRGAHIANAGYLVAEQARGRGIGRALGEHSLTKARELGYAALQFNQVVATNTVAVGLWKQLGLRILAEIPAAFRHPEQGLVSTYVMFREL